jgi:outer membrane receptor protein involved in Fe transport
VTYAQGPLNLRALVNYVGKGKYDNTYGPLDVSKNDYSAVAYLDLSAQYDLTEKTQIYAKLENVLDQDPPLASNSTITIAAAASSAGYDNLGRLYGVGIRYRW